MYKIARKMLNSQCPADLCANAHLYEQQGFYLLNDEKTLLPPPLPIPPPLPYLKRIVKNTGRSLEYLSKPQMKHMIEVVPSALLPGSKRDDGFMRDR